MTDLANRPVTVHLMRHGEVENPGKILYGRLPGFHLSARGQEQARTTSAWLVETFGDRLVHLRCSPLERAQETVAPLAAATGLAPVTDPRLVEAANELEGRRVGGRSDLAKLLGRPAAWRLFINPWQPSWGEPYRQVAARVYAAALAARAAALAAGGGDAVCVSHQLPVYVTRLLVTGRPLPHSPSNRQCSLASVTSLTFVGPAASPVLTAVAYAEPAGATPRGQTPGA